MWEMIEKTFTSDYPYVITIKLRQQDAYIIETEMK